MNHDDENQDEDNYTPQNTGGWQTGITDMGDDESEEEEEPIEPI